MSPRGSRAATHLLPALRNHRVLDGKREAQLLGAEVALTFEVAHDGVHAVGQLDALLQVLVGCLGLGRRCGSGLATLCRPIRQQPRTV